MGKTASEFSSEVRERAVRLVLTDATAQLKALECENRELRQANEILCKARARILRWCEGQSGTASSDACSGSTAGRSDGVVRRCASGSAWG